MHICVPKFLFPPSFRIIAVATLSVLCSIGFSSLEADDQLVRIGVLAHRGTDVAQSTWTPLINYLQKEIPGHRFQLVPLYLSETYPLVSAAKLDFILTNSGNYVDLRKNYGITALATLNKRYEERELNRFGAVVFARADQYNIRTLRDLRGKVFMGVNPGAFGGFQMAWRELKRVGVDPFTDLRELKFSGYPQSKVVFSVRDGLADAGTVRTGILESLAAKGKIKLSDFRILNRHSGGTFPFLLSTTLFPEWPFSRLAHTDDTLASQVKDALLAVPTAILAGNEPMLSSWGEPANYQPVDDLMRELQVGPYSNDSSLPILLLLKKHSWWLILITIMLFIMIGFIVHILILNRRVSIAKTVLERKVTEGRELEKSLQKERNFLQALLNNIHDGVVACNEKGEITLFNSAARKMHGIPNVNIPEQEWPEYYELYRYDEKMNIVREEPPLLQALSGKAIHEHEILIHTQNGMTRHVLANAQSIYDNLGNMKLGAVLSMHDITERVRNELRIRKSEKELRAILTNMQDAYYRTNKEGFVVRVSPAVKDILGYTPEECIGRRLSDFYVEAGERERFLQELNKNEGSLQNYHTQLRHKDGSQVWVATNAHYYIDESGRIDGVEGVTRNITELKNAEASLFREKERAEITLQSIGDGVITTDTAGVAQYLNPYAEQMTGRALDAVFGHKLSELLCFVDAQSGLPLSDPIENCLHRNDVVIYSDHIHAIRDDGAKFAVKLTLAPMRDPEGHVIGVVLVMHDVSEMWEMARQLSYQASHDALTGLINRREFERRLEQALIAANRGKTEHTLCYMDLDQFKIVNDTCGHIAGDRLLKQIANVLKDVVRENDIFARLGGDEFGLLLESCPMDKAEQIVDKARKAVSDFRFSWQEKSFEVGVSIGLVSMNRESASITELLSEADAACYVAKDLGRNRYHKYQHGDSALVRHRSEMQWVQRIKKALEDDRFTLYCQYIEPLHDRDPVFAEVLLRMLDEDGDLILPGTFIPAAERYRLMPEIDRWVVSHVFAMLAAGGLEDARVCAINLSGQSVGDPGILEFIIEGLQKYQVEPGRICFEITETAAVANLDEARNFIARLHDLGCLFALDDFGSGLSSFAYLKNLQVNFLKIDGSFVRDITQDPVDYAMVASINQIGHLMGIKTIAESVEDGDILEELRKMGVDYAQGYAIDPPTAVPLEPWLPKSKPNKGV